MTALSRARLRDARTLDWVRRRAKGETCVQIGAAYGMDPRSISRATETVRKADAAESGEDIEGEYW